MMSTTPRLNPRTDHNISSSSTSLVALGVVLLVAAVATSGCGVGHLQRENEALRSRLAELESKIEALEQVNAEREELARAEGGSTTTTRGRGGRERDEVEEERRPMSRYDRLKEECGEFILDTEYAALPKNAARVDVEPQSILSATQWAILETSREVSRSYDNAQKSGILPMVRTYVKLDGRDPDWSPRTEAAFTEGLRESFAELEAKAKERARRRREPVSAKARRLRFEDLSFEVTCGKTVCLVVGRGEMWDLVFGSSLRQFHRLIGGSRGLPTGNRRVAPHAQLFGRRHLKLSSLEEIERVVEAHLRDNDGGERPSH